MLSHAVAIEACWAPPRSAKIGDLQPGSSWSLPDGDGERSAFPPAGGMADSISHQFGGDQFHIVHPGRMGKDGTHQAPNCRYALGDARIGQ
jgi:hypothetical protein